MRICCINLIPSFTLLITLKKGYQMTTYTVSDNGENAIVTTSVTREDVVNNTISSASTWAAASSLIPIHGLDLAALAAVQVNMIMDISSLYGQKISNYAVKGVISTLLGTLVTQYGAKLATNSLIKWIPYAGLLGVTSTAAFGSASTYAIGKIFANHYAKGGTFESFDPKAASEELKTTYKNKTAE